MIYYDRSNPPAEPTIPMLNDKPNQTKTLSICFDILSPHAPDLKPDRTDRAGFLPHPGPLLTRAGPHVSVPAKSLPHIINPSSLFRRETTSLQFSQALLLRHLLQQIRSRVLRRSLHTSPQIAPIAAPRRRSIRASVAAGSELRRRSRPFPASGMAAVSRST